MVVETQGITQKGVAEIPTSRKRVLILTCSAGNGHLQAAKAKIQEIQVNYPYAVILQRDLLIDWVGSSFGGYCARLWNEAQTRGNIAALEFLTHGQKYVDPFIATSIFFATLQTVLKEEIDTIIDTQPLGTKAIIKALRYIKWRYHKTVLFEKIVTDLPTKKANHFFRPIRKLSYKDRKCVRLMTTFPLLQEGETEGSFWNDCCHLPKESISYSSLPLRRAFHEYAEKESLKNHSITLTVKASRSYEADLIEKALSFGTLPTTREKNNFTFRIEPGHKVCLVMLGSNPHEEAILSYIDQFISKIRKSAYQKRKDLLFIFCSPKNPTKNLLQEHIVQKLENTPHYPPSLAIILLPYQEDEVVAPLFHRSDASITRSGGLTSMELLTVSRGQIWIHKGSVHKTLPRLFLLGKSGMPSWERGNADYLQAKRGARLISPDTFAALSTSYFAEE